jgi:hypothetical protein
LVAAGSGSSCRTRAENGDRELSRGDGELSVEFETLAETGFGVIEAEAFAVLAGACEVGVAEQIPGDGVPVEVARQFSRAGRRIAEELCRGIQCGPGGWRFPAGASP